MVLGALVLSVAIAAILGAYVGQLTLNEHARNLSLATNDANRVVEQIRQQNSPCPGARSTPTIQWPAGSTGWDNWLGNTGAGGGGGRSILPIAANPELIVVTCQTGDAVQTFANCSDASVGSADPIRVTVAICWRHRARTIGECTSPSQTAQPVPSSGANGFANNNVTESPVMLTTLVTCR